MSVTPEPSVEYKALADAGKESAKRVAVLLEKLEVCGRDNAAFQVAAEKYARDHGVLTAAYDGELRPVFENFYGTVTAGATGAPVVDVTSLEGFVRTSAPAFKHAVASYRAHQKNAAASRDAVKRLEAEKVDDANKYAALEAKARGECAAANDKVVVAEEAVRNLDLRLSDEQKAHVGVKAERDKLNSEKVAYDAKIAKLEKTESDLRASYDTATNRVLAAEKVARELGFKLSDEEKAHVAVKTTRDAVQAENALFKSGLRGALAEIGAATAVFEGCARDLDATVAKYKCV